jgi:hypothetical protein
MSKSKKPAPKKVAAKKPAAKKPAPKKPAIKPKAKPVKNKATKPATKPKKKAKKVAKTPEQKLLDLTPNANAIEAQMAATKSTTQEETMSNIPAPPNVLNPAMNATVVVAFPPDGWTLHPESAKFGQNFYYMGTECISETDLRARCAPPLPSTAVVLPPAPPMPAAAATPAEAPKRKRRTKAEIAADEAAKAAQANAVAGAPQAVVQPAAPPAPAPVAQAAPAPVVLAGVPAVAPVFAPPQWQQPVAAPTLPPPVAAPAPYNPINEANMQELSKWYSLTVQMAGVKEQVKQERELRADIFNRFFPAAEENTNNLPLPGGWGNLQAKVPIERKVIQEKMAEAFAELATVGYTPEQITAAANALIGWEPKLNLEAYRLLPGNVKVVVNKCLDIKVGSVGLELQLPQAPQ